MKLFFMIKKLDENLFRALKLRHNIHLCIQINNNRYNYGTVSFITTHEPTETIKYYEKYGWRLLEIKRI